MRQEPYARVLRAIAEERVADDGNLDLWPVVRARLRAAPSGSATTPRPRRPQLVLLGIISTALLALTIIAAVPNVQAGAQRWMRHFGLILVNRAPHGTPATVSTGGQPSTPRPVYGPRLTLAQAKAQLPFAIRLPTRLPAGLVLLGASVGEYPGQGTAVGAPTVTVYYSRPGGPETFGALTYQMTQGTPSGGVLAPATATQAATVHGYPAIYAHGYWRSDGTWDPSVDNDLLSWEEAGFTYTVSTTGLELKQDDLLQIAESIH